MMKHLEIQNKMRESFSWTGSTKTKGWIFGFMLARFSSFAHAFSSARCQVLKGKEIEQIVSHFRTKIERLATLIFISQLQHHQSSGQKNVTMHLHFPFSQKVTLLMCTDNFAQVRKILISLTKTCVPLLPKEQVLRRFQAGRPAPGRGLVPLGRDLLKALGRVQQAVTQHGVHGIRPGQAGSSLVTQLGLD